MDRKDCGKRRNCSLRAISPFPTVFSKALRCRHVKYREKAKAFAEDRIIVPQMMISVLDGGRWHTKGNINPLPKQALAYRCQLYKSFENTVGKVEIACIEQFLFFLQCFLPVWRTFCHFHQI